MLLVRILVKGMIHNSSKLQPVSRQRKAQRPSVSGIRFLLPNKPIHEVTRLLCALHSARPSPREAESCAGTDKEKLLKFQCSQSPLAVVQNTFPQSPSLGFTGWAKSNKFMTDTFCERRQGKAKSNSEDCDGLIRQLFLADKLC